MAYNGKNTQDNYYGFFVRNGRELYLLDVYSDTLYETNLDLSQDESIRMLSLMEIIYVSVFLMRGIQSLLQQKDHYSGFQ